MIGILLIDDDQLVCDVIGDYLQSYDMMVHCACSGELGAEMLAKHNYDLAIIDVTLRGMSGLDLAAIAANGNTSVLLTSGCPEANLKLHRFDYPFLVKPFTLDALRIAAARVISEHLENLARVKASAARMLANTKALKAAMAESDRVLDAMRTRHQLGRWEAIVDSTKRASAAPR